MNLGEIAEQCKVSLSTVSLVLNDKEGVSSKKRKLITKVLLENNYVIKKSKKASQRSIRFLKYSKHSYLVNGNLGFVSSLIDAIEKECRLQNYNLVINAFNDNDKDDVFEMIKREPLDGIIMLGTEFDYVNLFYFKDITVPIVFLDNPMDFEKYDCVTMNNKESTYAAVKYLFDLGHKKIGYLYNTLPSNNCLHRRTSYENSIKQLGLHFDPSLIYQLPPIPSASYEHTSELLKKGITFPPALVANNDSIALGAIKAFREFGIAIPEDISIIGFDDISASAYSEPPLTTMRVNCKDMGIWAVRLLCNKIDYPDSTVTKILINTDLIVRKSTCKYH